MDKATRDRLMQMHLDILRTHVHGELSVPKVAAAGEEKPPFNHLHFLRGPLHCSWCDREIGEGMRHYPATNGDHTCWVGTEQDGQQESAAEPDTPEAPAVPEIVPPTHRCVECGAERFAGDELFDGLAQNRSRWLLWKGELRHMCHGYAREPNRVVEVNIWS